MTDITCSTEKKSLTITFLSITITLIVSIIIMKWIHIRCIYLDESKSSNITPKKTRNIMSITGSIFFIMVIFGMTMHCIFVGVDCFNHSVKPIFHALSSFGYILQCVAMLLLWFIRINIAFSDTLFVISKITTYIFLSIFLILFVVTSILSLDGLWGYFLYNNGLGALGSIIQAFLYILLLISLSILFIYKLIKVYKSIAGDLESNDHDFIDLITKITILNFLSLFITICMAATIIFYSYSLYGQFINHFCVIFDYFSNFICVILSYTYFNGYYLKCCGCIHNKCSKCWFFCVNGKGKNHMETMKDIQIISKMPKSPLSSQSETSTGTATAATPNGQTVINTPSATDGEERAFRSIGGIRIDLPTVTSTSNMDITPASLGSMRDPSLSSFT